MLEMDVEAAQRKICRDYGVVPFLSPAFVKAGVSVGVLAGEIPLNGLRHLPEIGTSGWFVCSGTDFSERPDYFKPWHVRHLIETNSPVLPFLGLPPGWRFLIAPGQEDVWFDPSLLEA
ncbi:hypothetical protein [Brevundimonas sp.]|uniref:immunity protein Imm33 domain-containing protein n=1 Tax=Brevundimonas sp. TaxID=1871086 RepID=UPI001A2C6A63|nr:hypothetical protein [Brevundimonas sp.]MBJ7484227.1 hypothetical protein [Brevundimonas sp.]